MATTTFIVTTSRIFSFEKILSIENGSFATCLNNLAKAITVTQSKTIPYTRRFFTLLKPHLQSTRHCAAFAPVTTTGNHGVRSCTIAFCFLPHILLPRDSRLSSVPRSNRQSPSWCSHPTDRRVPYPPTGYLHAFCSIRWALPRVAVAHVAPLGGSATTQSVFACAVRIVHR